MLIDQVKDDLKDAILNKKEDVKSILRVVIGELNRRNEKEFTDEVVISVIKKVKEDAEVCGNNQEGLLLNKYLPKQMSEDEIKGIVKSIIEEKGFTKSNIGDIMKESKSKLGVHFNGNIVKNAISTILN